MEFSKEKIDEIKKKHGGAFIIECDGKSALLRKPNRNDMSYALAASNGGKDAIKMNEAFLNNLWVEGDEEIRTDDSYFFATSEQLGDIFEKRVASLKKL
jgi:hypothetical protein